jgi:hypothetical protein
VSDDLTIGKTGDIGTMDQDFLAEVGAFHPPDVGHRGHVVRLTRKPTVRAGRSSRSVILYFSQTSAVNGSSLSSARASRQEEYCLLRIAMKRSLCVGSMRCTIS